MHEEALLTIDRLLTCPTTLKILLAMLEHEQVYQFQLTLITGSHRATVVTAIKMLTEGKLIRVVEPKVHVKNTGEFYGLTAQGKDVAQLLQGIEGLLERHR